MLATKIWAVTLGLSTLALARPTGVGARGEESLRFAVEAGTSVTRTFSSRGEFSTALVDVGVSGMEVQIPDIELSARWRREVVVEDEYRAMGAGRPTELARRFETIDHRLECEIDIEGSDLVHQEELEPDCESALEGTAVLFTWNEDTEQYDKRYIDEEDADASLLEGLTEDMDLRALLPEDEVEVGDEWSLDPQALLAALMPGGDLGVVLGRGDAERGPEMVAAGLDPRAAGALESFLGEASEDGTATATLTEVRTVDGRRMAIVAIEAELETSADRLELYEAWMADYDPEGAGVVVDLEEARVSVECELKGELMWDLEGGHAHTLELTGDLMVTLNRIASVDADGQEVGVELELELEGDVSLRATFE